MLARYINYFSPDIAIIFVAWVSCRLEKPLNVILHFNIRNLFMPAMVRLERRHKKRFH